MTESTGGVEVLKAYFAETMQGDLTAIDRYFVDDPQYVLIAPSNPELAAILPCVGAQSSREGIKRAYGMLLSELNVIGATEDVVFDAGEHVVVCGTFTYEAKPTGRTVNSDWAVHATVRDGLIQTFHFYEDSYAVASAFRMDGSWEIKNGQGEGTVPRAASAS